MSDWKETTLGELINFTTGKLNSNAAVVNGKYPFFTCSPETLSIDTYAFDCKAILLAGNNANGQYPIKIYDGKFNAYQRTYVITPKDIKKVELDYLYYLLSIRLNYFKEISQGSATKFLTAVILRNLSLELPPIDEQKEIAAVLSCLGRKIENLRKQNETLEQIAQTLFKHWFVDFEFPYDPSASSGQRFAQGRPSADGKPFDIAQGRPYKSSGGEMVPSELGEIPAGWRVGTFDEFFDLFSGGTPKTSMAEYWDGDVKWLSAKDVTSHHRGFIISTEKTISSLGLDNSSAKLLPRFTTVISARGTVGNYCIASQEMTISQSNFGVLSKQGEYTFSGHLLIVSLIERLKREAYGSVFDTITTSNFRRLSILIPSLNILSNFEEIVSKIFRKTLVNFKQIQTLTQTRDALLPKLMSGQLRIQEGKT